MASEPSDQGGTLDTAVSLMLLPVRLQVRVVRESVNVGRRVFDKTTQVLIDDAINRVLTDHTIDRVFERVESERLAQQITERLLASGVLDEMAQRAIEGPELERFIRDAMESSLADKVLDGLATNEPFIRAVRGLGKSPAVTDVITHQAGKVSGQMLSGPARAIRRALPSKRGTGRSPQIS